MRNLLNLLILLVATTALAASQGTADRPSVLQASISLLNFPVIHKELKLSAAQIKKIDGIREETRSAQMSFQQRTSPPSEAEVKAFEKKMRTLVDRAIGVLSQTQQTRLRQIGIQKFGIFAVVAKDVKGMMGLSAAQESKIRRIQEDADKKVRDLVEQRQLQLRAVPQPKDPNNKAQVEAYRKKVMEMAQKFEAQDKATIEGWQKSAETQAMATLTAAQKTKWKQILGPAFDFSKLAAGE